jgi:hypothetical protein
MQCSLGNTAVATSYNQGTSNQKYTFAAPSWLRGVSRKVSSAIGYSNGTNQGLPYTSPTTASACAPSGPNPAQRRSLHMIACMRHDRYRHILHQDPIDKIRADKELFFFMRTQLARRRGAFRKLLSCTCISGLRLVKVNFLHFTNKPNMSTDANQVPPLAKRSPRLSRRRNFMFITYSPEVRLYTTKGESCTVCGR